jgi:hypothetical protein
MFRIFLFHCGFLEINHRTFILPRILAATGLECGQLSSDVMSCGSRDLPSFDLGRAMTLEVRAGQAWPVQPVTPAQPVAQASGLPEVPDQYDLG